MLRFFGIRKKFLFIYLFFGLIPLLLISYHSFQSASEALERLSNRQLSNLTAKTATQARQMVREIRKDIDLLSDFPFIQLAFLQFAFGQRMETIRLKLENYQNQNDIYSRISLISMDGEVILTVPDADHRIVADHLDSDRLRLATLVDSYISGPLLDHPDGPLIIFSKRVYDFENPTEPVGLLAFYIRLETLSRYIEELDAAAGTTGFIFDHNLQQFLQKTALPFDPRDQFSVNKSPDEVRISEAGEFKLFMAQVAELNWSVGITLPKEILLGDIIRLKKKSFTLVVTIAVLALLTTLFFVRRITEPIARLMAGTKEFSDGNLDHQIEIRGEGELRRLGEEFNAMAKKIQSREKQLRQVDRLASLGILATGVAHEVRNPLAGMKSCAQLMQRKAISDEVALLAGGINEEIDRLDKIVRELLDFAKPKEATPESVHIGQLLDKVLDMVHKTLEKENIEVIKDLPPTRPVQVDADQVHQVFLNLILNAAQAMRGGGRLEIGLRTEQSRVVATIADNGCGIAPEHLERIFDPFFTLNPGGTGLGLAVVHSLMVENRIGWQVRSTLGQGTVFELFFEKEN